MIGTWFTLAVAVACFFIWLVVAYRVVRWSAHDRVLVALVLIVLGIAGSSLLAASGVEAPGIISFGITGLLFLAFVVQRNDV